MLNADLKIVQDAMDTNVYGAWRMVQAFLPLLKKSAHARIVNVSSGAGAIGQGLSGNTPAYAVSKVALNSGKIQGVEIFVAGNVDGNSTTNVLENAGAHNAEGKLNLSEAAGWEQSSSGVDGYDQFCKDDITILIQKTLLES